MSHTVIKNQVSTNISKPDTSYNPYNYAAIYVRKSTQADNYSLQSQEEHCRKEIIKENLILHNVYRDEASATKNFKTRKGFSKLLNDLYAGMFKTIIIARMDRLSRNIDDFIKLKNIFKKHDIRIIYVQESILNTYNNNYMKNFMESMLMAVSTFEPQNINERTSKGKKEARNSGRYPLRKNPAYGFYYKNNDKNPKKNIKKYFKHKDHSKIISKIFNDYINKVDHIFDNHVYTLSKLVDEINNCTNTDKAFNTTSVKNIIKKPIYAKYMLIDPKYKVEQMICRDKKTNKLKISDENLIECINIEEPIISLSLWKKAVIKLCKDTFLNLEDDSKYLFKGLVYCKYCNSKVKLINDLYECSKGCFKMNKIDLITIVLKQLIFDLNNESIILEIKNNLPIVQSDISNLKKKLDNLDLEIRTILKQFIENPHNKKLEEKYKDLESKKLSLVKQINDKGLVKKELLMCLDDINSVKDDMTNFNNLKYIEYLLENEEFLHEIISNIIEKVVLSNQLSLYGDCEIEFKSKR